MKLSELNVMKDVHVNMILGKVLNIYCLRQLSRLVCVNGH